MKNNKGFSLVELIVVIAIMAILAAVAVVGFSFYIPKAQQANDKQLISDIEYALNLAYHNGDFTEGEGGYIVLSTNGVGNSEDIVANFADLAQVLKNTYGEDWVTEMKLAYEDWGFNNQILNPNDAATVIGSTFVKKYSSDELMEEVQDITSVVNGLQFAGDETEQTLEAMFTYTDAQGQSKNAIDDVIAEYGITKTWDEMTSEERSNVMVLATASSINNGTNTNAAELIPSYALYTAYAKEDPEFAQEYEKFKTTIANVDPNGETTEVQQIAAAYRELQNAATQNGFDAWSATEAETNRDAFKAIMQGVGNAMKDNSDAVLDDLDNPDMFTTGVGNTLYNEYLDSAYSIIGVGENDLLNQILEAFQAGEHEGEVIVYYTVVDGILHIGSTMIGE